MFCDVEIRYYVTAADRSPGREFLASLSEPFRGQILADLTLLGREGEKAPISKKPLKGCKPMWELRIGGYRVLFVRHEEAFWVLGVCKKQNQDREIAACVKRMKDLLGR
jgi:mRNA-degrading endonuclease RelE of RelBE toxin-antitoxin system